MNMKKGTIGADFSFLFFSFCAMCNMSRSAREKTLKRRFMSKKLRSVRKTASKFDYFFIKQLAQVDILHRIGLRNDSL